MRDIIIWAEETPDTEWQCIECGHVVEAASRPGFCPHCNMWDSDYQEGVRAMARRDVVGWFP